MQLIEIPKPEYAYCEKCKSKIQIGYLCSPEELSYEFPDPVLRRPFYLCENCYSKMQSEGIEL